MTFINKGKERDYTHKISLSLLDILLSTLLVCAVVYVGYLTFEKLNPYGLDSDVVNEISYRQASWEQKSLFPEGFVHGNETYANRPVMIYWFFYALTHNFMFSFQLGNICVLILQLAALAFLLRKLTVGFRSALFALCMYVAWMPMTGGSAANLAYVLFWPMEPYSFFAIIVMLTMAMMIEAGKKFELSGEIRNCAVPLLVLLLLAAFSGYTTLKMTMVLYIPLFLVHIIRLFLQYVSSDRIPAKTVFTTCTSISLLFTNMLFYALCSVIHRDAFVPVAIDIAPVFSWTSWPVISAQLGMILTALGFRGGGALTSLSGVNFLVSACFVALEACSILWIAKNAISKKTDKAGNILFYWVAATSAVCAVNIFTASQILATRYYFVTTILLPVLCGLALHDWENNQKETVAWVTSLGVLGLWALFGITVLTNNMQFKAGEPVLAQVAAYIEDNDYHYVTASYWNAGVIKGYTNGQVEAQHSYPGRIHTLEPYHWMIDVRVFEQERAGEPNILLLTDEEEAQIVNEKRTANLLLQNHGEKVAEIGGFNLYELNENPYTLVKKVEAQYGAGLPAEGQREKTVYPSNIGFIYQNAALNENNELISDGNHPGHVLYGPYSDSIAGTYDITLHYVVESYTGSDNGVFDVALDTGPYRETIFTAAERTAVLEHVEMETGHRFEVRVFVPEGMIIRVQSIDYKRIEN